MSKKFSLTIHDVTADEMAAIAMFAEQLRSGDLNEATVGAAARAVAGLNATSAAPNAPVTAPAAAPSTSPIAATASPADARGVPHHPDFHAALDTATGGKNPDGSWKRRRGHNRPAADAYEAQYLTNVDNGPQKLGAPGIINAPAPNGSGASNVTNTQHAAANGAGASIPPIPMAPPAPPSGTPGMQDLETLWFAIVNAHGAALGEQLSTYLQGTYGGHPVTNAAVFMNNPQVRHDAYEFLKQYNV